MSAFQVLTADSAETAIAAMHISDTAQLDNSTPAGVPDDLRKERRSVPLGALHSRGTGMELAHPWHSERDGDEYSGSVKDWSHVLVSAGVPPKYHAAVLAYIGGATTREIGSGALKWIQRLADPRNPWRRQLRDAIVAECRASGDQEPARAATGGRPATACAAAGTSRRSYHKHDDMECGRHGRVAVIDGTTRKIGEAQPPCSCKYSPGPEPLKRSAHNPYLLSLTTRRTGRISTVLSAGYEFRPNLRGAQLEEYGKSVRESLRDLIVIAPA